MDHTGSMGTASEIGLVLPTGTVTFLFGGVERSEQWDPDPAGTAEAIRRCAAVLADQVIANGGARPVEQGESDGVVGAFVRASDAVAAAVAAQVALTTAGAGVPVRVSIALHTGEAELRDDGSYYGPAIIRAARLRDLARAGQVLLSRTTADLVADALPPHVALLDLGVHRLRDLARPEHIFGVRHPDLVSEFLPLGPPEPVHNLGASANPFIGREDELVELQGLLAAARLVTLTGPGGCGKTRLAGQVAADVADRFAAGAWWVDLAVVANPDRVVAAVLTALGVRDTRGLAPTQRLADHLRGRELLLVLDNCEHVLAEVAALVDAAVAAAPDIRIVTTSREPLGVAGEIIWRVPPLSLPPADSDAASLTTFDAVRLFIDRAVRARPNFVVDNNTAPAVAAICICLDGIALAIELAAARVRVMSVERILSGLDDRFRLLTGGSRTGLARQQTLQASVEWSHALLVEPERIVLRRLAVLVGSFTLDAAEAVAGGDGIERDAVLDLLSRLVDKSLVVVTHAPSGETHFRVLQTIRHYGRERLLEAGETAATQDRHLAYELDLAERLEPAVEAYDPAALGALEENHENLRAALEWSLSAGGGHALRLAAALALFWTTRGYYAEGRSWLERALEGAGEDRSAETAKARWALAHIRFLGMDAGGGFGYSDAARAVDEAADSGDDRVAARAATHVALLETFLRMDGAEAKLDEFLVVARRSGDTWLVVTVLTLLAYARAVTADRDDLAAPVLEELDAIVRQTGNPGAAVALWLTAGQVALRRGRVDEARTRLQGALAAVLDIGDPALEMLVLDAVGDFGVASGDDAWAAEVLSSRLEVMSGSAFGRFEFVQAKIATAALLRGEVAASRDILEEILPVVRQGAFPSLIAAALTRLGQAETALGQPQSARTRLDEALAMSQHQAMPWSETTALGAIGRLAVVEGAIEDAEELQHRALTVASERGLLLCVIDALEALAELAVAAGSSAEATRVLAATERLRDETGYRRAGLYAPQHDAAIAKATADLGDDAFLAAWTEGTALDQDETVAYVRRARGVRKRPTIGWGSLTPTEARVVDLAAEGLSNAAIGRRLFVGAGTVKTHLSHVYAKLGVANRAELAAKAAVRSMQT